ncbi:response regulator [Desulfobacula toluolica]|uniref:histidine kinase n=1 Tax=Desulfobacula toluolica (strain DSM 7467 / Tol2) TaxID=651182 RepID=K0NAK5_DESTT|nr:response regulator [Desulfobacula toluolica]CCK81084.1 two component system sensor histidine kinase, hybrid [Desulfobacula toluolica Tol2]
MNLLNNLTIKARMLLASAVMVVLFIVFSVISIHQMGVLGQLTSTLYNHPLKASNAALKAKAGIISMHRSMKDLSTAPTPLEISRASHIVQTEEKKVFQELFTIKSLILGQEGKKLVEETIELFAGWKPIRLEVGEMVFAGDTNGANRITRGKGADYVARLERKMSNLTFCAFNNADAFMKESQKIENTILKQTVFFVLILILIVLTISFFIVTSIVSSLSDLKDTMIKTTETGKLIKAAIKGNNEITEMSKHFNGLVEKLKGQFWHSEGRNILNRELSGELTYNRILIQSIEYTARYVDACAGALYIFDKKKAVCELKSSYALVETKQFSKKFKFGEGIVGQVALEKKPILLKNITRQDALGQSGTLCEKPSSIFVLPLFYEETLHGVLEIASFEEISRIKKEFLISASKIISVVLHTASQKEQIKSLLAISQDANEKLQVQAEELQAQTEELQAMNEESRQQSEELREQNLELEAQQQQLEEASRLKSEFLSNMSHELRTPLNSVNALSRVLILQAKEKLSREEVNFLEIIERNGKHLLSLINDILDLSKIEAGKMDISLNHFSIKNLIENIIEGVEPLAREKKLKLLKKLPEDLPEMESDESRIFQILQNIVANGIKFTAQGSVIISAEKNNDNICIKVKDTGIGMSDADIMHIFDEFRQVDGASTRKFEGTGLGLAIANKAAKMLGGSISVKSAKGRGSTFTINLPVKYAEAKNIMDSIEPSAATPIVKTGIKADKAFKIQGQGSFTHKNQRPNIHMANDIKAQPEDVNRHKILLVEDNDAAIIQVKKALETIGLAVDVTRGGQQALEYMVNTIPDGIILDLMMPNIDGFKVLESIRGTQKTKNIPVLILTAKDLTKQDLKRLSSNNIQQLVQKGDVDREDLLHKVNLMFEDSCAPLIAKEELTPENFTTDDFTDDAFCSLEKTQNVPVILVVEDNLDNMTTIKAIIRGEKTIIEEAFDGEQGLNKAMQLIPDLILLDISLPNINGLTVVKKLKNNAKTKHIPVIALTAQAMKGDKEEIIRAGCDDYLAKPIDPEQLLEKIKKRLSKTNKEIA